jgi:hypothetical protein
MQDVELIISANGCTDNTKWYLQSLRYQFDSLGFGNNLKILWSDAPLGYAGANNVAIEIATASKIVLLNNDVVLLEQSKNQWLDILAAEFNNNPKCGVSCLVKTFSPEANADFAIFFCVMVSREAFDIVGLLNTIYGAGAGEDVEFCVEAQKAGFEICQVGEKILDTKFWTGSFPLYHAGEGTYHDKELFPDWDNIFYRNSLILSKKYNPLWYKHSVRQHVDSSVYFKDEVVDQREKSRYIRLSENIIGNSVLEIGCKNGYGSQFFPDHVFYSGIDDNKIIIECAKDQIWKQNSKFMYVENLLFDSEFNDTVIISKIFDNGDKLLKTIEYYKPLCNRLLVSLPYKYILENNDCFSNLMLSNFEFGFFNDLGDWVNPNGADNVSYMIGLFNAR